MTSDGKSSIRICDSCGKLIRVSRKGTMTDWIFGGNNCKCGSLDASLSQRDSGAQAMAPPNLATAGIKPPELGTGLEILDFLGQGGMGTVWKARDTRTDKVYAVKVLKHELSLDEAAVKRFEREVAAASQLTHQNLVFVYGAYRTVDGRPYMVMNYVDGSSLSEALSYGALSYTRALPIFRQVAEALSHAHDQGIVHRDLKPSNILLYKHKELSDLVRLVDFGIAKMTSDVKSTGSLTQTGDLFGSPLYMSPEQCSGEELDARSDIYSLGCVMYQSLSGLPPFSDSNAIKTMVAHMQVSPPILKAASGQPAIPKNVETVVMRCLAKKPSDRYQSAAALVDDLKAVESARQISRPTRKSQLPSISPMYWKVGAIVFCSFAVGVFFSWMILNAKSSQVTRSTGAGPQGAQGVNAQPADSARPATAITTAIVGGLNPKGGGKISHVLDPGGLPYVAQVGVTPVVPVQAKPELLSACSTGSEIILAAIKAKRSKIFIPGFPCTKEEFDVLRNLPFITELDLSNNDMNDDRMEVLTTLPNLRVLTLRRNRLTDSEFERLTKLKKLVTLNVSECNVTDVSMKYISQLHDLVTLNLSRTGVTDLGVALLAPCKSISQLDVSGTKVTDRSLKVISSFKALTSLSLATDDISYDGLQNLVRCSKLENLNLHGCAGMGARETALILKFPRLTRFSTGINCTDALVKIIAQNTAWDILMLDGPLTDATFDSLSNQKAIAKLALFAPISRRTRAGFVYQTAHPQCDIEIGDMSTPKIVARLAGSVRADYLYGFVRH